MRRKSFFQIIVFTSLTTLMIAFNNCSGGASSTNPTAGNDSNTGSGAGDGNPSNPPSAPNLKTINGWTVTEAPKSTCGTDLNSTSLVLADNSVIMSGNSSGQLIKITPQGLLDKSFGSSGILSLKITLANGNILSFYPYSLAADGNGRILVGGRGSEATSSGTVYGPAVLRLNADGTLDTSFSGTGAYIYPAQSKDSVKSLKVANDGSVFALGVIAGSRNGDDDLILFKVSSLGALDDQFGVKMISYGSNDFVAKNLLLVSGNKVLIQGTNYDHPKHIVMARYLADGTLDTSFGGDGYIMNQELPIEQAIASGLTNLYKALSVESVIEDSMGRYILGGTIIETFYGGNNGNRIFVMRLTESGAQDTTFSIPTPGIIGEIINIKTMSLLPDGKILLGGTDYDKTTMIAARMLPEGAGMDTSIGTNGFTQTELLEGSVVHKGGLINLSQNGTNLFAVGYGEDGAGTGSCRPIIKNNPF